MEALSVYHARSLGGYRKAQDLRTDSASTEDLREAMIRCRELFEDLTGLRESQVRPGHERAAEISGRAAATDHVVAGNGDLADRNRDLAAQNGDLAGRTRNLSAEDADRTADTQR